MSYYYGSPYRSASVYSTPRYGSTSAYAAPVAAPVYSIDRLSYWSEPQSGGHKSISLEKELRDRGLHASANAVANGESLDYAQVTRVHHADVEMQSSSPHRFRTGAYSAHLDAEMRLPIDQRSPRRAISSPRGHYLY
eukprot:TRINITY_DN6209_c0_g1_i1.p1 TRINITY_DN6209_c0_g1~~TRINITY_DN6209_c0_g1_i1.p1  ORF type:complete len:137 (+),score=15.72 TRINITY_DN6209_c0_g1_i1:51-461(+)